MNIISENLSKTKVLVLSLLFAMLFATTAFGLGSTSTATLSLDRSATGENINIWEGYAKMNSNYTFIGSSIYGGAGAVSATIKKAISVLPDTTVYNKNYTTTGSRTISSISIPNAGTYYAEGSSLGYSSGTVTVTSLD